MAWPGGKDGSGVVQRLVNQIPPHDVFVSGFLGDCAILRKKLPSTTSIGIDLSRDNVDRWARKQLVPGLRLYCCCGIEWLRHAFGLYLVAPTNPAAVDELATLKRAAVDRHAAADAQFRVDGSGGKLLRWFVYLDPPYLIESRRSRKRLYAHELDVEHHVALLDVALALPCNVMVSHYPHPLYEQRLGDWRSFTYESQTRSGRRAIEQVWCNYPEPVELHDSRFVGGNRRERERVRRRVNNAVAGLDRMEPFERQAILDAIACRWFGRQDPDVAVAGNRVAAEVTISPAATRKPASSAGTRRRARRH